MLRILSAAQIHSSKQVIYISKPLTPNRTWILVFMDFTISLICIIQTRSSNAKDIFEKFITTSKKRPVISKSDLCISKNNKTVHIFKII